jgi:hypothetical protein
MIHKSILANPYSFSHMENNLSLDALLRDYNYLSAMFNMISLLKNLRARYVENEVIWNSITRQIEALLHSLTKSELLFLLS